MVGSGGGGALPGGRGVGREDKFVEDARRGKIQSGGGKGQA